MKHICCLLTIFFSLTSAWAERIGAYQQGTVVRMRMGDCASVRRGFISSVAGPPVQIPAEACPEYTLVSDKVVFVIVGKSSNQLIPLADVIDFRFRNNELAVRVDDAKRENKFSIKEMILRSDWDLMQKHMTDQLNSSSRVTDDGLPLRTQN